MEGGSDPVRAIGDLWARQDGQGSEFDFSMYDSRPWMAVKVLLSLCIITLIFLLYGLRELPWTLYGSAIGMLVLGFGPFFAGLVLGYSFERPKMALACTIAISLASTALCFALMILPRMMGLAEYGPMFMSDIWYNGFFIPFLITITFVPAGTMLGTSTNIQE